MRFTFSLLIFYNLCLTLTSCCHSDMNQDHRSRVNCSGMALSDVPSAIDPATAVIVLTDNEFVSLSWTSYQRFHQLHELDLSRNKVSSLQDMPDLILPSLKVLHLTGNQLQELRASAFIAVSNVMELHLRANQIRTLNNETFKGLKMLEVLDLSQNLIQVLPLPLLKVINTKVLKNFDVEDNRLKVMPDQFFSGLPDIPYVYLSKNPWVCNCKVQYLSGWLEDQGHNVYVHTGPSKVVNDPESVVCDSPSRLKLQVIMDLTKDDYCPSSPLGDIDAIETPAPTTAISTILPTIYALTMPIHTRTTTPTLSQTTTFSLLSFYNLCLTLTSCCHSDMNQDHRSRVNCSGMALSDVPSAIDPATAVIVLTDNEFVSLSWTSYRRFHQLHELDLSRNKVSSLQDMPDLILPSLKVLHLTGNQLQELRASAFIAVSNVMELHLRANQIRTLNNETFKGLKMLEVLDLSQNLIQVLPLPLLKVINTKVLKNFDVEDNRLKVMPDQFFSELPDIPYVYLSKNPWVCNCKVQYLSGWLEDQGHNVYVHTGPSKVVNDPESVVCDSPRRLKLRVIMDLTEDDYCPSSPLGDIDAIETPVPTTAISTILPTIYALTMPIHTRTTTPTLSQTTTFSLLSFYNLCLTLTSCCHSDMNQDHRSRVNCSGMALSDVPSAIDPATAVIVLTDNEFVSLSWTSYQRFHQLHELDLSRNKVSSLQDMPDLILPSLKVLHLTGNQLQELRASAFIAVSKVMEIYLRANQIHTLNNETFKGLKMLEVLDLSQNLIQVLPLPLLKVINTKVLKNFDVEDNRLKVMPDQFFSELPDIPYVYLSKNPWVCNCKVQYLSGWLEDQGHNVYVHTGPSKVVNDPESVVCDSPSRLKLRVIMDLTEDDYCPSSPLSDIDAIETPAPTTAISTILPNIYVLTMPTHSRTTTTPTHSQTTMPTTLSQTTTPTQTHTTTTDTFSFLTFQVTTIPTPTSTSSPPSTPLSTTPTAHHPSMTDPPWTTEQSLTADYVGLESRIQERPVVFYCWWLFIGYLFLCVLLALWLCIIFLWSLRAYLRVYLPLARKNQEQRRNTLRLLGYHDRQIQDREGNVENAGWTGKVGDRAGAISLPLEGAGGVQAMFRSVLFVDRPRDRKEGQGEEECERVKSERTDGPATSQGARRAEIAGGEEREVHRKTVIKLISREEEIRGWSHVAMSEKDNPGNQNELEESVRQGWSESNRRASELKKRYSLILREERVEGEEQDSRSRESSFWNEWVVGEWMLRDRGGEGAGGDTGEEDWWSLMPLIARSTDPVSRGGDSSTATSVMTSETQL